MISDLSTLGDTVSPAAAAIFVPRGTLATAPGDVLVRDIRAHLANRSPVKLWESERGLFDRLPEDQRISVKKWQRAFVFVAGLTTGKGAIKVQPACRKALEIYPLGTLNTFRGKYDAWVTAGDWLILVNRSKAGAEWQLGERGLPAAFLDFVAARKGAFKRGDAGDQAIRSLHRQWETGRNHKGEVEVIKGYEVLPDGTPWEKRNVNLRPDGWSIDNINAQLKKQGKYTAAQKALLHHSTAEARKHLPQVHGTREGLRFLEQVQFDDVRCDFRVMDTDIGQVVDLWLLVARDVATSLMLGFGMRPARVREDGTQEHLRLRDMKQLTGWLLETYGLPPYQMTWKIENGTATLSDAVAEAVAELVGPDRINVSFSSMIGGKSVAGYKETGLGNSKAKAMLESLHRLMHMLNSHLPGQIGAHYGLRPKDLAAREKETVNIWKSHRPEDRAQLKYGFLTIPEARAALFHSFEIENRRTDHTMEDFMVVVEWFDGTAWRPRHTAPADMTAVRTRTRMESPLERAGRLVAGCAPFTRVSPEVIVAFYEHSQCKVKVEDNGEIEFMHEKKKMYFKPPAPEFALAPGTKGLGYFNPDDPRFLTITDARGGILGTWLRRSLVKHGDREALAEAIRYSTTALRDAKARANELGADEQAQLESMRLHNTGFEAVVAPNTGGSRPVTTPVANTIAEKFTNARSERRETARQEQALKNFAGDISDMADLAAESLDSGSVADTFDDGQSGTDFAAEGLL